LKPFDTAAVRTLASRVPAVFSIENGTVVGGLGSAVAEALAGAGSGTRLTMLGVQDHFPVAGSLEFLLVKYGLTPAAIAETVERSLAAAERVANTTDMDCTGGLS
ncbi:MAG TPA: transketolase C-terminal domain-containing protein, partial [Chloroflexota bacterium]|nr:transketolase C-terminal domain-containing protein [Chloroflexota bacterium]